MKFYYIYKALAHPGLNGYVTPYTLEERLMQIQEAKRTLGSRIPWISDTMSNDLKHALGDASNPEFIIDPDGRLANKRMWSDPEGLREDLARLVGPVENPTDRRSGSGNSPAARAGGERRCAVHRDAPGNAGPRGGPGLDR